MSLYFETVMYSEKRFLSPSEERLVGAEAHQDSWVSIISSDHFLQLVQQQPALSLNLARILSERLDESRNDIEALTFLTTEQRVGASSAGAGSELRTNHHLESEIDEDCNPSLA